jgi:hypothetical protein
MTRGTHILRRYRGLLAGFLVFGAGILVGHNCAQPDGVPVPVAQAAPDYASATLPSDAPVANLITLRSMTPDDQARFLSRMTDPQLLALQIVAVTTPDVLPQANDEALSRGLPELTAGAIDPYGAVQAVPVSPTPLVHPAPTPGLGYTPMPDLSPQVSDLCDGCKTISA